MQRGIKRQLSLASLLVIALLLTSWYAHILIENKLRNERAASLQTVLGSTHQALRSWYKEQSASAIIWADNPRVRRLTESLLRLHRQKRDLINHPDQAELRNLLAPVLQSRKYAGYFILDTKGINLSSSRNSNIGIPNLLNSQPAFLDKLANGESALSLPQVSDVPLPNGRGELHTQQPTMFVGAPVHNRQGRIIAYFVFRIDPLADYSAILQRGRIGKTGETITFSRHGRVISNSRFEAELRMRGLLQPGEYSMLNTWLRSPPRDTQEGEVNGYDKQWPPNELGLAAGKRTSGQNLEGFVGYYGEPVISVWLWDEQLQMGIATEMGRKEAYQTSRIVQYTLSGFTLVALIMLALFFVYTIRSQRELSQSQQLFSTIIDSSDEAVISIDAAERMIMVNQATERMFGYSSEEMLHQKLAMLLPVWAREQHGAHIKGFMASGKDVVSREVRNVIEGRRKNGENFPIEATISRQEVAGRIILTATMRDITERLKADEALRNSERMFRQVFEASEDAILMLQDGRFVDCNQATVRMLHARDREEVLSKHPWDLSPEFQPDGQKSELKAQDMIRTAYQRHFHRFEWLHRRMDGEEFPVEVTLTTTQIAGKTCLHVMWNEIAERKQAEDALRNERDRAQRYLDTVEALMVALDKQGNITMVNRKACEVLGYLESELIGQNWFECCMPQPEGVERVQPIFQKIINNEIQQSREIFEDPIKTRDGEVRIITWHTTLLRDKYGSITGMLSAGQDITSLKSAEKKEEQLQRQLMHAQKMEALGRLTGGIAHDFNNILASAKGYTELAMMIAEETKDEKQQHYLTEVYKSTDRAAAVVKQLLAFARGSQAEPEYQLLQEVVEDALTMMRPLLTSRIEIETRFDGDLPPVLLDNVQINQVLLNLCINARDAMQGEGHIEIGVRRGKGGGECSSCHTAFEIDGAELYVSDDGPGIEADSLSRIFDPFFTSKEVGKGSGMGLSVVHGIIHDHHGHILVESEVGKGTTFRIFLPFAD